MSTTSQSGPDEAPRADPAPRSTDQAMPAARAPVGRGASPLVAQLVALGFVGLGVVGVQDLLARAGALGQAPWTDTALSSVDGLAADSPWVLLTGILAAVVGLLLLPIAARRRPRKTLEVRAETGVRLRTRDLPVLVRGSLELVDGVTDVDVRATRRAVRVQAATVVRDGRRDEVARALDQRLAPTLAALEHAPRPRIELRETR